MQKKSFNRGFTDYFFDKRKDCFNFDSPKSLGEYLGKIKKVGKNWFEISSNADKKLNNQDGLYFNNTGCLVNYLVGKKNYPNRMDGIAVSVDIYRNFNAEFEKQFTNSKIKRQIGVEFVCQDGFLSAKDEDGNITQIKLPKGEPPKNPRKMKETFINQLKKTGESDFYVNDIQINNELSFMPVSEINEQRRKILTQLMRERIKIIRAKSKTP